MTKYTTLSLTSSVKSLLVTITLISLCFIGYGQQMNLDLQSGEEIHIEVSKVQGLRITGEGTVFLHSEESIIQIEESFEVDNGVKLVSEETIQLLDGGVFHGSNIDADIYFQGSWSINSSLNLKSNREVHFHNSIIDLGNSSIVADNFIYTGENTLNTSGGIVVANKSFISNGQLELPSFQNEVVFIPETAEYIDDSELPVHFFSSVVNPCGDPEFELDIQIISDYNGEDISCNGADDAVVQCIVSGGSGDFTFQWFGGSEDNNSSDTYSGLGAGTYTVLVTDIVQGVTCVESIQIAEPPPLAIFTMNLSSPTCSDVCNGTAFPIILGGTGSYSFEYSNGIMNQVAVNLCEGENTLMISDINSCSLDTIFVLEVDSINTDLMFTDSLCFGDNSAMASVNPSGGGGEPYQVIWSTTETNNSISNLSAGVYSFEITDGAGCVKDSTFTITEIEEITVVLDDSQAPVCANDADGSISVTISGGIAEYILEWTRDGNFFSADEDLTGIEVGLYELTILDSFGCTGSFSLNLEAEEEILVDTVVEELSCFGDCNASLTSTVTQGQDPIIITWSDVNGIISNLNFIDDLCAGLYELEVMDATGCTYSETFDIQEPEEILVVQDVTDVSCNGLGDGSITLTISGGTGPFISSLPSVELNPNQLFLEGFSAGSYSVDVTDDEGCVVSVPFDILEPLPILIDISPINPNCFGENTGSIDIVVSGGSEPYSIEWVELGIFDELSQTDLISGDYNIEIIDDLGCEESVLVTLVDPLEISVQETITDVLCNGEDNGSIELEVFDAVGNLDVNWIGTVLNPADLNQFNLIAGSYEVTITDDNGCLFNNTYEIIEGDEIEVTETISNPSCFGDLGEISLEILGGQEPYSVSWLEVNAPDQTVIQDLAAGFYTAIVTDANLCETTNVYEIIEPEEIVITTDVIQPNCVLTTGSIGITNISGGTAAGVNPNDYTINWTGVNAPGQTFVTNLAPGDYSVIVSDDNNCLTEEFFTINEPGQLDVTETITEVVCFEGSSGSIELVVLGAADPMNVTWTGDVQNPNDLNQFNLEAGQYTVDILDDDGCEFNATYEVTENEEILISETIVHPGCLGTTGEISIEITGGSNPYSIVWPDLGIFDQTDVNNLLPGDYIVQVTDLENCLKESTFTIDEPGNLDVQVSVTNVLCNGESTGSLECTVNGATDPIIVNWTNVPVPTDLNQFNLAAGIYDLQITDDEGCEFIESFEILEEELVVISETITNPSCAGDLGEIEINITGGVEPYEITWVEIGIFDQTLVTNLTPGSYEVQVTDANDCVSSSVYEIISIEDLQITEFIIQPGCAGSLGSIEILEITGGTGPYDFIWLEVNAPNQTTIIDLDPGDYTIQVTDANDCVTERVFTVTEPGVLGVTSGVTDVLCNGDNTGSIILEASGGLEPYTAVWTPVIDASLAQENLAAGIYEVIVSDADGCEFSSQFEIQEPETLSISETVINPLCFGELGEIEIEITGGVEPYSIVWSGIAADGATLLTDLFPGVYEAQITDANNCVLVESYEIISPDEIEVSVFIIQPGCAGTLGSIEILEITGGTEPYDFIWLEENAPNQTLLIDLNPGDYTLRITDDAGCIFQQVYTITPPGVLDVTSDVTDVLCNGDNSGSITLEATGGLEPYMAIWTPALDASLIQENLFAGIYEVTVSDADGCEFSAQFEVQEPADLVVTETIVNPLCFEDFGSISLDIQGGVEPYSITWTGVTADNQTTITDLSPGTYDVLVADANGCEVTVSYEIISPDEINVTELLNQPGCEGTLGSIEITEITGGTEPYSFIWLEITAPNQTLIENLTPGDYTIQITDAVDCSTEFVYTITEPGVLAVDSEVTDALCSGENTGSITLEATGGLEPYTAVWTPIIDDQLVQENLFAGVYEVTVSDADGCEFSSQFEIQEPEVIVITETLTHPLCFQEEGNINIDITGGVEPYTITWLEINADGLTDVDVPAGTYTVNVSDANGCQVIIPYEVIEAEEITVNETVISPGCTGATTGSINVEITGGNEPYSIEWAELAAPDQTFIDNLAPGDYNITITDANDCVFQDTYTILPPGILSVNLNVVDNECFGESEGSISIEVNNATDPLTITWTAPIPLDDNLVQTGLPSGIYEILIVDDEGCEFNTVLQVSEPPLLVITETISLLDCSDDLATIDVVISGGVEPYTIIWTGVNAPGATNLADLPEGNYSITVTDANDCVLTEDYIIEAPDQLEIEEVIVQPTCFGDLGTISVEVTGGTGTPVITWTGIDADGETDLIDLTAGVYTILVSDENGCSIEETYEINLINEFIVDAEIIQPECFTATGEVNLTITGGTSPYSIVWPGLADNDELSAIDITPGSYSVQISDANLCALSVDFEISEPYNLEASDVIQDVRCSGENTGAIEISLTNTTGNVDYNWSNPDNGFSSPSEDIENLEAGEYTLIATDELGCEFTDVYTINQTDDLQIVTDNLQNETCFEDENGSIEISISGGTPDYSIEWSNGTFSSSDENIFDLAAGDYNVSIEDINGCTAEEIITVNSGAEITPNVSSTDSMCGESTGSMSVNPASDNLITDISWFENGVLIMGGLLETITDLPSGMYSVQLTDAAGCQISEDILISDSDAALIDVVSSPVTCFGDEDGSISVTIISGTEPYSLTWSGLVFIPNDEYEPTNLPSGSYTAAISDAEGCNTFQEIIVDSPDSLVISETITHVSCNGNDDGEILLDITGGTDPYDIFWTDLLEVSNEIIDLTPGDYNVVVTDENDCTADGTYTVIEEQPLLVTIDFSEFLCSNEASTDININVTGGVLPYSFSWTGDLSSNNEDLADVVPGTYTITVTDAADCIYEETIIITQGLEIVIDVDQSEPNCLLSDGSLTANVSGGSGMGYSYFWYSTTGTPVIIGQDQLLENLEAGIYYLEVFDSANCFTTLEVNLSNNQGEVVGDITDILCAQEATGAIDITVSDMADPLNFEWSGPINYSSDQEDIDNLLEGDYTVIITDDNGCILIETFNVESTDELEVDIEITNICFGETGTGAIDIVINGGVNPYQISWTGNGLVSDETSLTDLEEGCYTLEVTDDNNCIYTAEVCVSSLSQIVLNTTAFGNVCFADELGQIDLEITGGDPGFVVEWLNSDLEFVSDQLSVTGLATGVYSVEVTDESLCSATTNASITSNPEIIVEILETPIVCPGDENGSLEIIYSGGVGDLDLSWTGPGGFVSTDDIIIDLNDGEYCFEITDAIGCVVSDCYALEDPLPLVLGESLLNISCFGENDGEITLDVTGGYTPYTQEWTLDATPFSLDEDISDLAEGSYEVILTDSMGCEISNSFPIIEPALLEVSLDNIIGTTCATSSDGSFDISITGGTPDYLISWVLNGETVSEDEDPTGLFMGDYELTITDANTCEVQIGSVILPAIGTVNIDLPESIAWCFTETPQEIQPTSVLAETLEWTNPPSTEVISSEATVLFQEQPGNYELVLTGIDGPCSVSDTIEVIIYELPMAEAGEDIDAYLETDVIIGGNPSTDDFNTVLWAPGTLLDDSTAFNPSHFVTNDIQNFVITVTSPEGCTSSDSMSVILYPEIDVHSGFTPNGDDINDVWVIGNYQNYPSIEVWIYNRWGEELFYTAGYDQPWDGTYNGDILPIGTYYYVIDINEPDLQLTIDGPVTILR